MGTYVHKSLIKTLDIEQENLAKKLGSGHRLLPGVAGSGKTLILATRAKWIAEKNTESRILITCFNTTLASYLRSVVSQSGDHAERTNRRMIEVKHFHAWAKTIVKMALPRYDQFSKSNDEVDEELAESIIRRLADNPDHRYDAILVDEGHMVHPSWFRTLKTALKDPENGDLIIATDVNQKMRKRQRFTWKSVGVNAVGRTRHLRRNYRNTQQILHTAWTMLSEFSSAEIEEDETFPVVKPEQSEGATGPQPRLIITSPEQIPIDVINAVRHDIKQNRCAASDIAILYRANIRRRIDKLFRLGAVHLKDQGIYWVKDKYNKENYGISTPGIRLITTQSALGLEFKSVYLLAWEDDFDRAFDSESSDDQLGQLRELYVAMTRAQAYLHIVCLEGSTIASAFRNKQELLGVQIVHN